MRRRVAAARAMVLAAPALRNAPTCMPQRSLAAGSLTAVGRSLGRGLRFAELGATGLSFFKSRTALENPDQGVSPFVRRGNLPSARQT